MAEIDQRLRKGEFPGAVAAWIQDDLQLLAELEARHAEEDPAALPRTGAPATRVLEELTDASKGRSVAAVAQRLNAMDELEDLAAEAEGPGREAADARGADAAAASCSTDTKHEIRLLSDMLVDLGRHADGDRPDRPRAADVDGTLTNPDGSVTEFDWTEDQEELFKEIEDVEDADFVLRAGPPSVDDSRAARRCLTCAAPARRLPADPEQLGLPGQWVWKIRREDRRPARAGALPASRRSPGCADKPGTAVLTRAAGRLPDLLRVRGPDEQARHPVAGVLGVRAGDQLRQVHRGGADRRNRGGEDYTGALQPGVPALHAVADAGPA